MGKYLDSIGLSYLWKKITKLVNNNLFKIFQMITAKHKLIIKILKDTIVRIENNKCGLDEDELLSLANNLVHIKLNIEQTCKYLNVSRATLNRMIIDGRIPIPYKDSGGIKYWYQDELSEYIKTLK